MIQHMPSSHLERAPICGEAFDAFAQRVREFHGYAAPGVLMGGIMVSMARDLLPDGVLFRVISETAWCLPDAVQLLTPCTVGNGRLFILGLGNFAVTLFDQQTGQGTRVSIDTRRLDPWDAVTDWLLKRKPKKEQDSRQLYDQIHHAGRAVCHSRPVRVGSDYLGKKSQGAIAICPECHEAFPARQGRLCGICQRSGHYVINGKYL